ncbi:hypothetical protein LIA77_10130 [Sarocladium implicatum]|nr:hypothetical protein LIA77_10130 [Sarocladium implicatum]
MTERQTHDSLDTLQSMLNNVLMETGKAIRAARKDGRGANAPARDPPTKMSESIRTFHQALDSLEQDIVSAKSVLQRDLKQIRENNGRVSTPQMDTTQASAPQAQMSQTPMPQPVDAQTRSPMVIDLDSSPPAGISPTTVKAEPAASAPMANTNGATNGITNGFSGPPPIPVVKSEPVPTAMMQPSPTQPATQAPTGTAAAPVTSGPNASQAPEASPAMPDNGQELGFTNMTFSLAPPNEEAPMSVNTQDQTFDMSGFAPTNVGNDMMALDNNNNDNNMSNMPSSSSNNAQNNANGGQPQDTNGGNGATDSLDDFDFDGPSDGLDFDFSIGGEDTFNTLMNERDGEFSMDQAFDADPFNMGKADGS